MSAKKQPTKRHSTIRMTDKKIDGMTILDENGQHEVGRAFGLKIIDYQRALSGEVGVLIILDLDPYADGENLYGYTLPIEEARKAAAVMRKTADDLELFLLSAHLAEEASQ